MGKLIEGKWHDVWYETKKSGGHFVRPDAGFRNWVTSDGRDVRDGSAGPDGEGGFLPEKGRYHLYVSLACPWAHRTLIFRKLKGLEDFVSVSVVHYLMFEKGWTFAEGQGVVPDPIFSSDYLYEVYVKSSANYTGRVTVPILWDKQKNCIVNNESSEIIRMFNSAFDNAGAAEGDYYPERLRDRIDEINERVYDTLNNGVYRCGFATTQGAYEDAFRQTVRDHGLARRDFDDQALLGRARKSPRRTGGFSRPWFALTLSTLVILRPTKSASSTTRTSGHTPASSISSLESPKRSTCTTSNTTTTAATNRSTQPESYPRALRSTSTSRMVANFSSLKD